MFWNVAQKNTNDSKMSAWVISKIQLRILKSPSVSNVKPSAELHLEEQVWS